MITTTKVLLTSLAAAAVCSVTAYAEKNADDAAKADKNKANREKMLEKFDTDKDGKLSKEEKKLMYDAKKKGGKGKKDDADNKTAKSDKKKAYKEKMLKKYDTDKDGKLSKEEKKVMKEAKKKAAKDKAAE